MARDEKIKTDLGQRLRDIRAHFGDPDREVFCQRLGISKGSLGNYERGDRIPDSLVLQAYRRELGVDANWLLTGEGEPFASTNHSLNAKLSEEIVDVQFQDLRVSAGPGLTVIDERSAEMIGMSRRILNELGLSPLQTLIMMVDGDSMSPSITDGAVIFVNRNEQYMREGRVYVLSLAGDLVVKRIQLDLDGGITLLSDADGPAFPPRRIDPVDVERIKVVGRVVCAMSPI
ncbi:XRE family transcriptional regulator [Martelella mediterranea]|uniref:Phage repressor protein C with HTH and peptisase S24 domain n=1 Tax=Martelella mediterranea TaxID=293089 RepID=A0A4R3NNU1_9HYPH|nr:S24 family peptidase [Martelella mediterranea]TCT37466.1 phage repressor protein C with HTH and peptisase S24 domain [Martelella mediterranea]